MFFLRTDPLFQNSSVFINDLQFCSFQLISGCCICFGNTCFCRLILNFFVQFNLCKILIFIGCVYIPYFLIWKISGFSDFLFDIVFSMWKITVESKCSLCICCFLFQQGIFLYENLSLIRKNIFRSIQSKNNTFQLFSCDRIFLFYRYGNFLSFIFIGNAFINNCLCIILCCQGKFFLFCIQDKILSCYNFFQIIRSQWQIVDNCCSIFICSQFGYQVIFLITDNWISFFILCSVR